MKSRIIFALKVLALSAFAAFLAIALSATFGLFLYDQLDKLMSADDLASFGLFFFPFFGLGFPAIIIACRFALLRTHIKAQIALTIATLLLGTLGFAGFWVGAMGI